ncbi:unnamed protein product [Ilex paraguariensis]|uniref:Exocyst subunit Exo70 family protein n=1 Tax=Ilex paraguariensis TaxID=185542 RepID=A0ABC8RLC4_9AQUA
MEINSFSKSNVYKKNDILSPRTPRTPPISGNSDNNQYSTWSSNDQDSEEAEGSSNHGHNIHEVSEDIDRFTDSLSTADDKSNAPQVPETVETIVKIIESRIAKFNSNKTPTKSGKMTEEDSFFMEAVRSLSKLANAFNEFPSSSTTSSLLDRTSMVLQRAMAFMEEEFRAILEYSGTSNAKHLSTKSSSFNSIQEESSDRCMLPELESAREDDYPGYSPEIVTKMNRIAMVMISVGYETECCKVYSIARRKAFNDAMKKLELEKINIEDVQRMPWESLEGETTRWIKAAKDCSNVLFPGERNLAESVFSEYPLISRSLFSNLARAVVIQLLDFAEAVAMTKRSAEKLFKFLDMYETLSNLIPAISGSSSDDNHHEMKSEISSTGDRIGEAAVNIFCDLENSIKGDVARTPVPGGAVHPLTRYVMNYLKYACEYKKTLEHIFQQHAKLEGSSIGFIKSNLETENESPRGNQIMANATPFSIQLMTVMDLLDSNLEAKSTLYKDLSLRYIFMVNNGRYILQKVKGSTEIHQVMGDTWYRRRSTVVRQFHKNYQRETWGRVLQCLGHEGLQVNKKVQKLAVKERFKTFSTVFDEIHKTQSTWVVSDEQLQSELRVSISALVIPAYRSFLGRFQQHLDGGRSAEKYIKYQPEDIETLIEGLFDGNPTSMNKRRT